LASVIAMFVGAALCAGIVRTSFEHIDDLLDDALADTFPASDAIPPADFARRPVSAPPARQETKSRTKRERAGYGFLLQ
jgi:hypothetical protein